ncbi:MAG TPA: 2Fe-2S iron-sulfur cluster-binding protein, partial [Desulfobacterales bacterium]|nr:2Fe-2S iron-sulfur cluster-binding protein [Desulfobacterales bacterium]
MLALSINGRRYEVDADPATPLLWILRDVLHLTGTKFGCGAGQCWSCTVLVDSRARPSCTLPASGAVGKEIVTIEGVAEDHPVKRAWVAEQVPQCG